MDKNPLPVKQPVTHTMKSRKTSESRNVSSGNSFRSCQPNAKASKSDAYTGGVSSLRRLSASSAPYAIKVAPHVPITSSKPIMDRCSDSHASRRPVIIIPQPRSEDTDIAAVDVGFHSQTNLKLVQHQMS